MEQRRPLKQVHYRLYFLLIGLGTLALAILFKAFSLQVLDRKALLSYSKGQTLRSVTIYPNRGIIYDRFGQVLAMNIQTFNIFTFPKDLKNPKKKLSQLGQIISIKKSSLLKKISKRKRYTILAKKIKLTNDQVQKIREIEGIQLEKTTKRYYPNGPLASQILGHVGTDNKGTGGIEFLLDEHLRGTPQKIEYVRDAKGRAVRFDSQKTSSSKRRLILTLDKNIQAMAEKILMKTIVKHEAKMGGIGVMDIKSGEILAMANYPTFDPNKPLKRSDALKRKLSFISDPFEPGSIFKTLTVASALEYKSVRPSTSYFCEKGRMQVEGHVIKEADGRKGHEWLSVSEIIRESSNIGTSKIAFDLTYPRFKKSLDKFGIGEKTGISLPGESRGIFNHGEEVGPLVLSNISFGQGVATTALQMLSLYGAIANGGVLIPPRILKNESEIDHLPKRKKRRILSSQTALEITDMLIDVVESGTGKRARIPYFMMAGKTSTAQKMSKTGRYDQYIPGFIGFPVNVKKPFVVFVYVDAPKGKSYYGGAVAAPAFQEMAHYILYKNKEFQHLNMSKKSHQDNHDKVSHIQSATYKHVKGLIPNFLGLDRKSARTLAKAMGLNVEFHGIGLVKKQGREAGSEIGEKKEIVLVLRPPIP